MIGTVRKIALTHQEIQFFNHEGYWVVENLFTDNDLQPVIDEISEEVDRRARELVGTGELSRPFDECDFETRLARISAETHKVANSIWHGKLSGPEFFHLICNPKLLDIAEQLCGPELIASSTYRLRPKVPGHIEGPVPWHQDSGYFQSYCDKELILTVWLPLVDATCDRGCMWVIPRAHQGICKHVHRQPLPYLEIPESQLPSSKPVCLPMKKGSVLLLTNLTPHASFENTTEVVRWSMDLRYQNAKLPTNAKISRLAGEVTESLENGIPAACNPPEADFLVRSRERPNEVVTDPVEFHRLRKMHPVHKVSRRWPQKESL